MANGALSRDLDHVSTVVAGASCPIFLAQLALQNHLFDLVRS